jgi:(p)ppGpp synthase/HD superfamily hydrolase
MTIDGWTGYTLRDVFEFAKAAHEGQTRKFSGDPYIVHPVRVSLLASQFGLSYGDQVVALLHDVVEDCDVSLDEIHEGFGLYVATGVWGLSNYEARNGGPDDTMNRAARKAADRVWLSGQSPSVKSLKIIDDIDNILDRPDGDSFMTVMLEEMRLQVLAMTEPSIDGPTGGVQTDLVDYFWDIWEDAAEEGE